MTGQNLTPRAPGWSDLLWGRNLVRSLTLSGGVALHAINLYLSTTILPSVVQEIGGRDYYAWNTTMFVVASILSAALSSRVLVRAGPRGGYVLACLVFIVGALVCATAPTMAQMLVGRFIQGLGGGLLLGLPYAMIRRVFAPPLWPRALALLSSMWGVATLLGPTIGGLFAQLGVWRAAFWSLAPPAVLLVLAACFILPRRGDEEDQAARPPVVQLGLLTLAVIAASFGSVGADLRLTTVGMAAALALLGLAVRVEQRATRRVLPTGVFQKGSAMGALYAASALLAVTVTCTEIFLPLFLQELHGRSPLEAGYIAAIMSAGWTVAAVYTSRLTGTARARALRAGPRISLASMIALAALLPVGGGGLALLAAICVALITAGVGVGLAYPHLAAGLLETAPAGEGDSAASSVVTVQLCGTAFGAALAGLVVNLAGGSQAGGFDTANAARWLFALIAVAPLVGLWQMRLARGSSATR
jgi:MFS family permease